jgi:virulence factor Mce-like protein
VIRGFTRRAQALLNGSAHTVIARLSALLLAGILVVSVGGYAVLHYGLLGSGPEYTAEFADAWPLVPGMDVRISGAVAGSVRAVTLTRQGTAEVTFQLDSGVPQPRADATVAIRQDDLLGDTDLSLELGSSSKPLTGPIPASRSIQEPRLDDFLDIFQKPVRVALKTFIVELGTAMENRGVDVNAAILKLRPGFEALGEVFSELQSQIGSLKQVLSNSHSLTSQLASRTGDLDRLVVGFERTITAVAGQSAQLDSGLARLPATLSATGTTLRRVRTLTSALEPLSQTIIAGAPGFQRAAGLVGPYANALSQAARLASPTVELAGQALRHSAPALAALSHTTFASLLNPTSGLFSALQPILGQLSDGLFGSNKGGGLGGTVLPGNDITAPNVDPARDYLSAYLVVSCELFGVPVAPGCLTNILATYGKSFAHPAQHVAAKTSPPASAPRPRSAAVTPAGPGAAPAAPAIPAAGAPASTTTAPTATPPPPAVPSLSSLLHFLLGK